SAGIAHAGVRHGEGQQALCGRERRLGLRGVQPRQRERHDGCPPGQGRLRAVVPCAGEAQRLHLPLVPEAVSGMSTLQFRQTTSVTPEQFVAGLTDFGPGRSKLFGHSADEYLKVHRRSNNDADVTEGSGGIWERLHYDWSDPARVVMKTIDSNLWGGPSGHIYTFTRRPDGATDLDAVVVRAGKDPQGRLLGVVLGTAG